MNIELEKPTLDAPASPLGQKKIRSNSPATSASDGSPLRHSTRNRAMSISTIGSHLTHPSTPKTGNTDSPSKKVTFEDQAPLIPNLSHDTKSTSSMIPKNLFMESLDAPSPMVETVHSDEESNKNNDTLKHKMMAKTKRKKTPTMMSFQIIQRYQH